MFVSLIYKLPVILKKNTYILIFIFLIPKISLAQNFIEYHKLVNNAELEIIKSNYDKSLYYYQKAFDMFDNQFSKDLYNASICALKIENDTIAYNFAKKMIFKGVSLNSLKGKSFKKFKKTSYWKLLKKIEKDYSNKNIDIQLVKKLNKLESIDQKIRKKRFGYPMSDTIRKVDSLNMIELVKVLDEYGFPDENIIGNKNPRRYSPPHFIVLRHFFQGQKINEAKNNVLEKYLIDALLNGKICPIQYSIWEDMRFFTIHRKHKYAYLAVAFVNNEYSKNELNNINEINEHRLDIGIGTYDDYVSKIIFQYSQKEFYFGINEAIIEF